VDKNCQFIFQLLQTELEPGLSFRTGTGIGLYVLRTGSGIGFLIPETRYTVLAKK
jgi:hypothetical protein